MPMPLMTLVFNLLYDQITVLPRTEMEWHGDSN
jgi:hypothetical protein